MLKIKDNVDLKELEKFGFKPEYDEDDGELYKYYHEYNFSYGKAKNSVEIFIYTDDKIINCWCNGYKAGEYFGDLLYDLIQADLVEKVVK